VNHAVILAGAASQPIGLNWALLLVPVGAVVAGALQLLLRLLSVTGATIRDVVKVAFGDRYALGSVVLVDSIGGALLGAIIALTRPTQPAALVQFIRDHSVLGWLALGLLGPFVGDLVVTTRFFKTPTTRTRERGSATTSPPLEDSARIRSQSSAELRLRIWVLVESRHLARSQAHRAGILALIENDLDQAMALLQATEDFLKGPLDGKRRQKIDSALSRASKASGAQLQRECLVALATELLRAGESQPVEAVLEYRSSSR
jgi:hypothetical protein